MITAYIYFSEIKQFITRNEGIKLILNLIKAVPYKDNEIYFAKYDEFINKYSISDDEEEFIQVAQWHACGCSDFIRLFFEDIPDIPIPRGYYLLTDNVSNKFLIMIDGVNRNEKYIQYKRLLSVFSIEPGEIELICKLNYDKIPDMDRLRNLGYNDVLPSFHEAYIDLIEKNEDYIHLQISGYFCAPRVVDLKMIGNIQEKINIEKKVDPYKFFSRRNKKNNQGRIEYIRLETVDDGFFVEISGTYFTGEWIFDEDGNHVYDKDGYPAVKSVKHDNELIIYCSNINIDFFERPDNQTSMGRMLFSRQSKAK